MGFNIGLMAVLALFVVVPLILYLLAIGKTKATSLPSGGMSIIFTALLFGAVWWYFDSTLLLVTAGLIAGGVAIQLWSKAPAGAKSIASWMIGGGAILGTLLLLFGNDAIEYRRDQGAALVAGKDLPSPAPPAPLSDQAQKDRLKREAQEMESFAAQRATEAAAEAKASEAARLVTNQTSNLPGNIAVPHCDKGMSNPVVMIPGWRVTAGWGVGSTPFDYLANGIWKRATKIRITESVDAVRYCTKSNANLVLGLMPLKWYPQ